MKKFNIAAITILAIVSVIQIVSAYSIAQYNLQKVGSYVHQVESLGSGTKTMSLSSNSGNDRVEYALNLSYAKKNIFGSITGYNFITGYHRWVSGGDSTSVSFDQTEAVKQNSFQGTIVYNNTLNGSSGNPVAGTFYLRN